MKLISSYVYGPFGPAQHVILVGLFGPARHENRPMGWGWAVGQARSPGQPGTVARRVKLGPGLGPGGPFTHLYLVYYSNDRFSSTEGGRAKVTVKVNQNQPFNYLHKAG